MSKPFFRADQVGSLLRPLSLIQAREEHAQGHRDAASLRACEDKAIAECVRQQEGVGLPVVVDGEFRRENWWIDFIGGLGGVEIRNAAAGHSFVASAAPGPAAACCGGAHETSSNANPDPSAEDDANWRYVPKNVYTAHKLAHTRPSLVTDYQHLAHVAQRPAKVTLPSPSRMHFHGGRASVSSQVYPDIEVFFADVARAWRAEIAALEAAGCRYIQIDDPLLTYFISGRLRDEIRADGDDPEHRLARYVRLLNDCIAARGPDTAVGVHLCRGNSRSGWISEGGYARIAEQVFGELKADHLLLEYDDERSGDFEPLAFIPRNQRVVLGLVTTKHGRLEEQDTLVRRIEAASRFVDIDRLAISPQCGFASTVEGNLVTPDDQWRKLDLVARTAQKVWRHEAAI